MRLLRCNCFGRNAKIQSESEEFDCARLGENGAVTAVFNDLDRLVYFCCNIIAKS
jgi:hypothetical protein